MTRIAAQVKGSSDMKALDTIAEYGLWLLGVLIFFGLIISYVVGFNIYYQQLYRKQGDLLGSVSLTLNPVDPALSLPPANTTFCGTGPGATSGQGAIPFARQPCSYLDPLDSVYPSTEVAALFVATRISRTNMSLPPGCDEAQSSQGCSFQSLPNSTSTSFVADVEMSTLQLEHLFTVPQFGLSRPSVQMAGALLVHTSGSRPTPGHVHSPSSHPP